MAKIIDSVLPLIASPGLVLFLKLIPFFDLRPMAHWTFDPDPSKFIVAAVAALFGYSRVTKKQRLWLLGASLVVFLACLFVYASLSDWPPTPSNKNVLDNAAFLSFFGYYFSLGFCVAHVCKFFTQKR
jgi:hypothetical protein